MKSLILYASKYGATHEIAKRIQNALGEGVLHDLGQRTLPDLAEFDCVIVGSSVYAGVARKEAKAFLNQYKDVLVGKKLGLFLSGLQKGGGEKALQANFPPELLESAKGAALLGGVFDPEKANAVERAIIKVISKKSGYIQAINDEAIAQFVAKIKDETA